MTKPIDKVVVATLQPFSTMYWQSFMIPVATKLRQIQTHGIC